MYKISLELDYSSYCYSVFLSTDSQVPPVGGKKVSFPTNEIYVGLESLNQSSTMGLMHGPKAIGEDPKAIGEDPRNPLYFMPWA